MEPINERINFYMFGYIHAIFVLFCVFTFGVHFITLFRFITMLCGIDNILGYSPRSNSVEYCQSYITLFYELNNVMFAQMSMNPLNTNISKSFQFFFCRYSIIQTFIIIIIIIICKFHLEEISFPPKFLIVNHTFKAHLPHLENVK